jgi:hypothetical protein
MEDKIVTLERYYDSMLAEIIRARLEANGIDCFIADQHTIGANPLYNQAIGGVKIKVFERDIEKCREILAEPETLTLNDELLAEDATTCPYCNSTNVSYGPATERKVSWITALLSFSFLGYPFFAARKSWHCFNCQHDFE